VETGKHDITVGRLMRVTQFFGVSITDLIPGQATADPAVVRQPERLHIQSASEGIEIYLLSPDTRRTMMPVLIDYEPGATPAEYSQHPGEEFICVIEGSLELELAGSETIVLREGDSAYYASTREHRYRNVADGRSRVFVVLSPPAL
jgi:quercetin dioxygenase-like cupin family protein